MARAAVAAIHEQSWTHISYWFSDLDPDAGYVVGSHADVARTICTAFAVGKHPVTARLVPRRVRRLRSRDGQVERDTDLWRHHTVFTDRPVRMSTRVGPTMAV